MYTQSRWKVLAIAFSFCMFLFPTTLFTQESKNVLLILSDDFNYWVNAMEYYPGVKTPNLDRLAEKGILFTQAYSNSAECNPSRNAMMSGFRPSSTGIVKNSDGYFRDVPSFREAVSLNQYFKEQGYFVYGGGKIYHPARMGGEFTDAENWTDLYTGGVGSPGGDLYKWSSEEKSNLDWSAGEFDIEARAGDTRLARHMARFIQDYPPSSGSEQPFFVAMGLFRPHLAWDVHKRFWDLYDRSDLIIPPGYRADDLNDHGATTTPVHEEIVTQNKWLEGIHAYLACLSYADFNVGIVLDALENSVHKENTIVVFAGDHGWHLGEKNRWGKSTNYDQASHTTFIIYDPSAEGNGRVSHKPVSLQDIYPTLVEIAGLKPKTDMEGVSLAPLLSNPSDPYWEIPAYMTYINTDMIRSQDFRLINHGRDPQLYKMDTDPYEWENLINRPGFSEKREDLRDQIAHWKQIGLDLKAKIENGYQFQPRLNILPGRIEAENYDEGVNHQTYWDRDDNNRGGQYRQDGVDIFGGNQSTGNGYIGDTQDGEWLQYSLYNTPSGDYQIQVRVRVTDSQPDQGIEFFLGTQKVGVLRISGQDQNWRTFTSGKLRLNTETSRLLRLVVKGGGFSIDRLDVEFAEGGSQCFSFTQQYQPGELDRPVDLNEACQIRIPNLSAEIEIGNFCGDVQISQTPAAGTLLALNPNQKATLQLRAVDGNLTSSYEVELTARDNLPPIPILGQLPDRVGQCQITLTPPEALDNCGRRIEGKTEDDLIYGEPGTYQVTWFYDDGEGQTVEQNQTVQVLGPTQWNCPDDLELDCNDPDIPGALNTYVEAFFLNILESGENAVYTLDRNALACGEPIPVQLYTNDRCADQTLPSCSFNLILKDTESPSQPGLIQVKSLSEEGLVITWNPSSDNVAVVQYQIHLYVGDSLVSTYSSTLSELEVEPLEPGISYRIEVVAVDGEGNTSESRVVNFSSSLTPVVTHQMEELLESWVSRVYPNPFDHSLTLVPAEALCCPYSLRVYDLMGRELWAMHENAPQTSIEIKGENWPAGIYFLELDKGNQQTVIKLLKK